MPNRYLPPIVLLIVACLPAAEAQVRAVYDQGAGALLRQLQRLKTTGSVMHTGAHPDDEDSALVAFHARHEHARTAYISLTRGSGGQNIIGTEQGDLLGVIRTEELLQARRLDGAEQLFTRAIDFGFSKHRSEAARLWDEEAVLGDMVRAIRQFRPDVLVSRWDGTPADGHGHHQFAGYLTPLAISAAADASRFPGQVADGLAPWQVRKFYVMPRIDPAAVSPPPLLINTGNRDPASGRSYFQIGMHGRSQQKTQQMGSLELHGRQESALALVESQVDTPDAETSVFDGIDTSLPGIAAYESQANAEFARILNALENAANEALARYQPLDPGALLPTLASGLRLARAARESARSAHAERLLDEKVAEFEAALGMAAGVTVDALADTGTVVPGGVVRVATRLYHPAGPGVTLQRVELRVPGGWTIRPAASGGLANELNDRRREHADAETVFDVRVPGNALPTEAYWLRNPRQEFSYDWSEAGDAQTKPFGTPLITALATLDVAGERITIEQDVQYRFVDPVRGEIRRRLDVVPALSVAAAGGLQIVTASAPQRQYEVLVTIDNHSPDAITGDARIAVPNGWQIAPEAAGFSLSASPAATSIAFVVTLPDEVVAGEYHLQASARVGDAEYRQAMQTLSYEHIQTHRVYAPASIEFEVIDVRVADVDVGYVMGSGDNVPEALRRLGLEVTLLHDADLASGDLSRFDTIVVGIRASQTRPAYVAGNQRLHDFVAAGGTLIVQYQQPDFIARGLAPFPASMEGNVRVVDETAPVVLLEPGHPVFNFPNRIDERDFAGWVQERNNYNFTRFDRQHYVPLTESHDEGESPSDGGMLYARIGDGHYVYTAYSFFRQLPNGVPGGYRLFANLLSLPASDP